MIRRRRSRWRTVAVGVVLLVLLLAVLIWIQRRQIATEFINRELARRGVDASYEVTRIGLRTQRLENLVIGDPRRPDLTAERVEVRIDFHFGTPTVGLITARGVRMFGRIVDGKLSLGAVDKLLPPPTGAPFRLPDQAVDVADVAMAIDTPAGRVGLAVEGRGNLADGFRGRVAAAARRLELGGCSVERLRASVAIAVTGRRPGIEGPVAARRLLCPQSGIALESPRLALDLLVPESLDAWLGDAGVEIPGARVGASRFAAVTGKVGFSGDAELTRGALDLRTGAAAGAGLRASRLGLAGRYAFSPGGNAFSLVGDARGQQIAAGEASLRPATAALAGAGGTPLGPLAGALSMALRRAAASIDVDAAVRVVNNPGGGAVRVERLNARSRSGARLAAADGARLTYYWPIGRMRLAGDYTLAGGGFPAVRASLDQPMAGGPVAGEAWVAPFAAGGARLQLAPIRFAAGVGGSTRIDTVALLDGPLGDGRVSGLHVPIRGRVGRGGFAFGEACTPVSVRALDVAGLRLGPTRLPLCPVGRALLWSTGAGVRGGAEIRAPRLAGRLGDTPLRLSADRLRFDVAEPGFTSTNFAANLGVDGAVHRLDLATLSGRFGAGGIGGTFAGGSGKLAAVPLRIGNARGRWSMAGGDLVVDAATTVSDDADPPRFYPLASDDFHLTLNEGRIAASAGLHDPESGTAITKVRIAHLLATGAGEATLDVPGIRFDETYQPEQLTRLTTGVVALVRGVVTGSGRIAWGPQGVTSTGRFSTEKMDLAANFGPVSGLTTTIEFTDLLGLQTGPGQRATVGQIQAGITVFDGEIRYQLLPDLRVKVESGRWPFAGGELALEETILDFSKPAEKRLTFRLTGFDAATFVQQLEFNNISATGTFDGLVPMVFDERGGRIVGGRLVARKEGGTLSYIGELTDKDLGAYGKLAFDALKSLRYDKLDIGLDGALDGEFVTHIDLDGIARNTGPQPGIVGGIIKRLAALRFEFNITAKGPFRTLLATTRSLEDPTLLIQSVLPEAIRDLPTDTTVQPEESETVQ